ncbi:hypothetical protein HII36_20075 [Nonomuraea sp. NN258]|uniref:hypothetical protein n=1 Tax=Nonomuraea antri TaxID=2730852 RepID=UPI00156A30F7|nr:hypothetical protein [Nonomuraea antri]NRQ34133.1 hypothetical protein [Nonomuraea antri]
MHRHRSGFLAVLAAAAYAVMLLATAGIALARDDLRALWRLTLFYDLDEADSDGWLTSLFLQEIQDSPSWPRVAVLVAVGGLFAWALWQILRGPESGPRPPAGRGVRLLRWTLYAQVAIWLVYVVLPIWPWWAVVLELLLVIAAVVAFHRVLGPILGAGGLALFAGLTGGVLTLASEVFDALDWRAAERLVDSSRVASWATLIWTVLVLAGQWGDGRWRRSTVGYGIAVLAAPVGLAIVGIPLRNVGGVGFVYGEAVTASAAILTMVWIARSAHDLADSDSRQAPPRPAPLPLPARPLALAVTAWSSVAARVAACVLPVVPGLVNLAHDRVSWLTPRRFEEDLPGLWWAVEVAAGLGGAAVLVLVAAHRGTRRTFLAAVTALLVTAAAGLAGTALLIAGSSRRETDDGGFSLNAHSVQEMFVSGPEPVVSPLWLTAACLASAALLWWARTVRAVPLDHGHRLPA